MRPRSLQSRIVLFFVLLLVLVQGVALLLVYAAMERNARDHLRRELSVGEKIFRRLLAQNDSRLARTAEILSLDFAFREAVATRDLPTIQSVLANHGARIGAGTMALVSLERRVLADTLHPERVGQPFPLARIFDLAERQGAAATMGIVEGHALQLAVVPVRAPTPIAWAVIGILVDDAMAKDLRDVSSLDVSFLSRGSSGWSVLASTLPAELHAELAQGMARPQSGEHATLTLSGREFEFAAVQLGGDDPAMAAVLVRSLDEAIAPYRRLGAILLILALLSVAASIAGSVLIARGVIRPVSRLSAATRRIEQGDYTGSVEEAGGDEIAELARRFNLMREAVAAREAEVLKLAYRDPLSDLPNRTLFNDRLRTAVESARRSGTLLTVLLMDLDRFKYINDTLGHPVGDLVLQQVARRLSGLVRKSDTTARLGGDEFGVLLLGAGVEEASGVARKMVAALEEPIAVGSYSLDVHASVGLAVYPAHGEDAESLVSHADAAMYAAKRAHSGLAVYDPRSHDHREEHLSLLSELKQAIAGGELRLVYQPKIELFDGTVTGAEALLRWEHPRKGAVSPADFIPFAEQTGFIRVLTAWVIDAAAAQAAAWQRAGMPIKVSVNVSTHDLLNPELGARLGEALARHQLRPQLFCVEITESGVMQDAGRAIEVLKRIQGLGVGRSIDDFGTGYSSLSYLKQLPVDELKMDRSFVRGVVEDGKDRAIVLSTIELAHNLGLAVVAEGVEDQATADMLKKLGCDEMQGWLASRPLTAGAFETWLRARPTAAFSRLS